MQMIFQQGTDPLGGGSDRRNGQRDFDHAMNVESLRLAKESGELPLSQSVEGSFSAVSFRITAVTSVSAHGSGTSEYLLLKCLVCDLQYSKGYKQLSWQPHRNWQNKWRSTRGGAGAWE